MSSQSLRPTTIAAITAGTLVTGFLAYAVYFDHRRRTDPEFRKQLKRESKRTAKAAKEEAESHGKEQKKAIREAVEKANEEGFPKDPEEVEAYFMQEVAQGEGMCQQGMYTYTFLFSHCEVEMGLGWKSSACAALAMSAMLPHLLSLSSRREPH